MSATIGVRAEMRSKSSIVKSIPKSRAIATRWSTPFVEPPVAATRGDGVLERLLRHEGARRHVVADELHREPADLVGGLLLGAVHRRDPVRAERREAEEVEDRRHRVGGELPAAGAGARARDRLELVQVRSLILPGGVRADPLVDVADRDLPLRGTGPARSSRCRRRPPGCRAGRSPSRRRGSSCRRRTSWTSPSKRWPRDDELDRVGDHLARDERGAHPGGAHRDAVRDRDRVELHRRAAGVADPALHVHREVALVEVARHRLDPRRADADDRLREILVGEAGALQHRACAGAVGAVGERGAVRLAGSDGVSYGRGHGEPLSIGLAGWRHHSLNEPGYILTSFASREHEPLDDDAGGHAGAAVDGELGVVGQVVGERLLEEGVARAGDPAGDGVERLDVAAPALRRAGVEQHERRVAEPRADLVGSRSRRRARACGQLPGGRAASPRWAALERARRTRAGRACRRRRGRGGAAATSSAPPSRVPSSQARTNVSRSTPALARTSSASVAGSGSGWRPPAAGSGAGR